MMKQVTAALTSQTVRAKENPKLIHDGPRQTQPVGTNSRINVLGLSSQ